MSYNVVIYKNKKKKNCAFNLLYLTNLVRMQLFKYG